MALPAGPLPQISQAFDASEALAGQWVTVYAMASLAAAIPLTAATRSWCRRPLLLVAKGAVRCLGCKLADDRFE